MIISKQILKSTFKEISCLGSSVFYLVLLTLTLVLEKYNLFKHLTISFVIVISISMVIKTFFFKDRPKKEKYSNFLEKIEASSFPSVHAMRFVSIAMILSEFFNNKYFMILSVFLTGLISYSRIYLKKHYFIDIFFGILFSIIINIFVLAVF